MATENEVHQFGNITIGGKAVTSIGVLKMNPQGLGWKSKSETGGSLSETVDGTTITSATWVRTGRFFQLELQLEGGGAIKFDGFREQDGEFLRNYLRENFKVEVGTSSLSTKGWNWGDVNFHGSTLTFNIANKKAFDIPLTEVSRCVVHNNPGSKNDVSVEFHQFDTAADDENDSLVEIRFHIPNSNNIEEGEKTAVQEFHEKVLAKADIVASSGKGILMFKQIHLLTPRGRYDLEMFPSFMKLHGKTYDYKILYTHISRLFQLPKPDQRHVYFVISLDPPIKQGQTRYPHLVIQFPKDETLEVPLHFADANNDKYKEKFTDLGNPIKGYAYDVVGKVFKLLTGKKLTLPDTFQSHTGASAFKCTVKANDGFLYPLERSFFFVHKPPIYIRFEDITFVEFARVSSGASGTNTRTFDLLVSLKSNTVHQFTGIQRPEYEGLINFIIAKKIKIKTSSGNVVELDKSDSVTSGEGRRRFPTGNEVPDEVEDSEESEDEDFVAGEDDEDDVPEEFDEEYEHPVEDEEGGAAVKRKDESPSADKTAKRSKKEKRDKKEKRSKKEKKDKKSKKEKKTKKSKKEEE